MTFGKSVPPPITVSEAYSIAIPSPPFGRLFPLRLVPIKLRRIVVPVTVMFVKRIPLFWLPEIILPEPSSYVPISLAEPLAITIPS